MVRLKGKGREAASYRQAGCWDFSLDAHLDLGCWGLGLTAYWPVGGPMLSGGTVKVHLLCVHLKFDVCHWLN